MPRLTVEMVARLQGFPDGWHFAGSKTQAYRQVGNALPPQLAEAVARRIARAFRLANGDVTHRGSAMDIPRGVPMPVLV
jgi:DNA (cytosine-5)-methyltransferase 1